MFLHNISDAHIELEDTLQDPQFTEGGYIKKFDRVIANPPFSQNYSRDTMKYPERFRYGFAPDTGKKADLMFVQHMIASLKEKGMMATIMPHGVMFRGGAEKVIREGIVRDGIIEAIIGLPQHLFYGTGIPACVLVINKNKPRELKNKILFINADAEYGEGRNQNYLRPEDIEKIVHVFDHKLESPKYSRLVDLSEIEANDFNLNIRRYVDNSPDPEIEDVKAHLSGGIPNREIELYKDQLAKYGISKDDLLEKQSDDYSRFKEDITEKSVIRTRIESHPKVNEINRRIHSALSEWWKAAQSEIQNFPQHNNVADFRREQINLFKKVFAELSTLDYFQQAGVFVNWWEEVKYDLKTIVSAGWSPSLIPDSYIKQSFYNAEIAKLEELEAAIAEAEGELAELVESIEIDESDEGEEKSAKDCKEYLKTQILNLLQFPASEKWNLRKVTKLMEDTNLLGGQPSPTTQNELQDSWKSLNEIEKQEDKLKAAKKTLKEAEADLEQKVEAKKATFSEEEAKNLILAKLYDRIRSEMESYLAAELKKAVATFEKLWDKYKKPLGEIKQGRDGATIKLDGFLKGLNYL